MEAFSLLKYWRAAATGGGTTTTNLRTSTPTTTISSTAVSHSTSQTDEDDDEENGPFFDLEFALPDEDVEDHDKKKSSNRPDEEGEEAEDSDGMEGENEEREDVEEGEFKFTLEPSDELFFKGDLVPVEASSVEEVSGQTGKPQFSLLKSASKFGVLMLKLKKSRPPTAGERTESGGDSVCLTKQSGKEAVPQTQKQKSSQSKLFTVKFKVEEVPIVSLFTRDNSSRDSSSRASSATINKSLKKEAPDESCPDEKRVSKEGVQKYLKMVKPLYIRVSKRHGEKAGFSGQLSVHSPTHLEAAKSEKTEAVMKPEVPSEAEEKSGKQGKLLSAGLRVVGKHLGKSRSASSAAVVAAPVSVAAVKRQGRRRDDLLLEQQDGIQSAILHCKRSFNLSRDLESTLLSPKNP